MPSDARSLALTTESDEAVAHFDATVEAYLSYRISTTDHLKACLAADPDFVMGQCLRGYLLLSFMSEATHGKARQSLDAAEAGQGRVTARERAAVAALRAWLEGDPAKACLIWDEILTEHPHDVLSLRLHHFATFWLGRSVAMRDSIAGVFAAWNEGVPGYGYVAGMYAFGLEEAGDYGAAEALGRRAVELNEDDLWSIHAVAHVLEMQGRLGEGFGWLTRPAADWSDRNAMREHLWWHKALFALEAGEGEQALALYDEKVRAEPSDFYLDLQNAVSLLCRLEFAGMDVGARWEELGETCAGKIGDHVLPFTDLHVLTALAAAGRDAEAERMLGSIEAFGQRPGVVAAGTIAGLALPLGRAILAAARGDPARAVDQLLPIRSGYARLGASHAQRDLFHQLLIDAALKARRWPLARRLLAERLAAKPASRASWRHLAETLEALGEATSAEDARARAAAVTLN